MPRRPLANWRRPDIHLDDPMMGEEVHEALPEGLSDVEAGVLLALGQQVVREALSRGHSDACFHRLRLSALRLASRPRRTPCVLLRLDDSRRVLAQTIVRIVP